MPDTETILRELVSLGASLPEDLTWYADLSAGRRKVLRLELLRLVERLSAAADLLDPVRQPDHVFDPTSPRVIAEMVARTLLLQERAPLAAVVKQPFYGAGVYAIYYRGAFDVYAPITGREYPVYVGKADPETLHAASPASQGDRLFRRLKDHHRSLSAAVNLKVEDFDCRYLVVRSAWVETAEDLLIHQFKPIWNNEIKICYGFGKHGDKSTTRSNERSPWDTLHPGRPWATDEGNTPNKRSVDHIRQDIAAHFQKQVPGNYSTVP